MVDLVENFQNLKTETYSRMIKRNPKKYKSFLRWLKTFKFFKGKERGNFMEAYYVAMRIIDDIVDGDSPVPSGYNSAEEYVEERIKITDHKMGVVEPVDNLMAYCYGIGEKLGYDFHEETSDILRSMLFDAKRKGKSQIFSEAELSDHFFNLDIRGTIKASLKVYGEDPEKFLFLKSLGDACRYFYTVRDYEDDISAGYVNISAEDCERFNISKLNLDDKLSLGVYLWKKSKARQGIIKLEQHNKLISGADFGWMARWTFPLVYAGPARKCFEKILKDAA